MTTYTCPTCKGTYSTVNKDNAGKCPYCGRTAKARRAAQLIMNGQATITTAYGIKTVEGVTELITDIEEGDL